MPADAVTFILDAETGEDPIRKRDVRELYNATLALLQTVEHAMTGQTAAEWAWFEDYHLPLMASVNGQDHPTLQRIAHAAHDALVGSSAEEPPAARDAPEFGEPVQKAVNRILRVLKRVDSITFQAEGRPEARIERVNLTEVVGRTHVRRVYSTVEGRLVTLSDRTTSIYGRIIEIGTARRVWCRIPVELNDEVSALFRHNVIASGMVAYDNGGNASSITDIDRIENRPRESALTTLIGAAPTLLGDRTTEEFLQELRGE